MFCGCERWTVYPTQWVGPVVEGKPHDRVVVPKIASRPLSAAVAPGGDSRLVGVIVGGMAIAVARLVGIFVVWMSQVSSPGAWTRCDGRVAAFVDVGTVGRR